ncbi:UNVERIFIED_CONTAM: hypothetical protein Slati_3409400 [Sesamum latifolium]|uniref:C2H2-type domain-containing protein n=1 Tax=Sesamum latifolium TaxID=2727402 RepID=A0AAW2UFU9_9LAMI
MSLLLSQGIDVADSSLREEQPEVHCSRERSRAAWKIIEEYLMPFMEKQKYQFSSQCRLHPSNDIFRDQEKHKSHIDINEWRCGYCKKIFRAEKYLDQHFDNRHYNLLNVSHGKCLADLCGALHCDFVMNSQSLKTKCNPAAAARNRHLCEVVLEFLTFYIRILLTAVFPLTRDPPQLVFMNFSYANSVMPTLAQEQENLSLGEAGTGFDVPSFILLDCIFVSKRNENPNNTAQAHLKTRTKTKALLMATPSV